MPDEILRVYFAGGNCWDCEFIDIFFNYFVILGFSLCTGYAIYEDTIEQFYKSIISKDCSEIRNKFNILLNLFVSTAYFSTLSYWSWNVTLVFFGFFPPSLLRNTS